MHLLYLVGAPAAGKSTLGRHLLGGRDPIAVRKPFEHCLFFAGDVAWLGGMSGDFPGTDRLAMNVSPTVAGWLNTSAPALVVGEGDRLATRRFFDTGRRAGYDVVVARVTVPAEVLAERRQRRTDWHPNLSWLAGRDTKAANLPADIEVPGDDVETAARLLAEASPVAARLLGVAAGA